MAKKLAIDWDENELRLVAAQCSGNSVKITDAVVLPVGESGVAATLKEVVASHGLEGTDTLVAIGRGKAELRELQLPPVPDEELPDMVRFQAIRSFANAGDNAAVDYLPTRRTEENVQMIAAAVSPEAVNEIKKICQSAGLETKRIALRPLSAASMYLMNHQGDTHRDTVLVDLLSDDAEIVVTRDDGVIFVRTVRLPASGDGRGRALAGELKRSLVACGSSGSLDRVVLWGRRSVHTDDIQMLAEAAGRDVDVLDPFTLVEVSGKTKASLPDHVGRLAPLVGLLASDENNGHRLIDFLNPRRRVEATVNPYRTAAIYGIPIAAVLLLAFVIHSQLSSLDERIEELQTANAAMKSDVDAAETAVERTEKIDQFLDGNVIWLSEIQRLAERMPPSDQMIIRQISATSEPRSGGGTLKVEGGAVHPEVIEVFERSLRDQQHRVTGDGASEQKTEDAYRWGFTESIAIAPESVRNQRYEAILQLLNEESGTDAQSDEADTETPDADDKSTTPPQDADSQPTEPQQSELQQSGSPSTDRQPLELEAAEAATGEPAVVEEISPTSDTPPDAPPPDNESSTDVNSEPDEASAQQTVSAEASFENEPSQPEVQP